MYCDPQCKPETDSAVVRKILVDAAFYIEEHGWCQAAAISARGEVCIAQAMQMVSRSFEDRCAAHETLNRFIGQYVVMWNDAPGRTKKEVVMALREAALC